MNPDQVNIEEELKQLSGTDLEGVMGDGFLEIRYSPKGISHRKRELLFLFVFLLMILEIPISEILPAGPIKSVV